MNTESKRWLAAATAALAALVWVSQISCGPRPERSGAPLDAFQAASVAPLGGAEWDSVGLDGAASAPAPPALCDGAQELARALAWVESFRGSAERVGLAELVAACRQGEDHVPRVAPLSERSAREALVRVAAESPLRAVMFAGERDPWTRAVLGGRIAAAGDTLVDGVRVERIERRAVVLALDGETLAVALEPVAGSDPLGARVAAASASDGAVSAGSPSARPLARGRVEARVSLELRGLPLAAAMQLLCEPAGVNVYLDASHAEPISTSFPSIAPDDALLVLLARNGLVLCEHPSGVLFAAAAHAPSVARGRRREPAALDDGAGAPHALRAAEDPPAIEPRVGDAAKEPE